LKRLKGEDLPGVYPFRVVDRDGKVRWMEINAVRSEWNGKPATLNYINDITERKRAEEELRRYEWIIEKEMPWADTKDSGFESAYGDVTEYNRKRLILDGVKKENLEQMAADVMALLDTSLAVYEANGDYAYGIFKSSWCRNLDTAAFKLSGTNDVKKALACGKWLCHENCWNDSAKAAIDSGKPVDIECVGGIRLYAVPVFARNEIIGVVNIGYGNPPKDNETLIKLSEKFNISFDLLRAKADAYKPRPDFIVELGKKRCEHMARMIGEIIESRQAEKALIEKEALFRGLFDHMTSGSAVYEVRNDGSKGTDYIIRGFNRKSLEIEGKKLEEVMGKSLFDLRPSIDDYGLIPVMKKVRPVRVGLSRQFEI
jgi:PAS domain-containing protein